MARGKIDVLTANIGRLFGHGKKTEPNVFDQWKLMMEQSNIRPVERFIELMKWDLMNQGVNLGAVAVASEQAEFEKYRADKDFWNQLRSDMYDDFKKNVLKEKEIQSEIINTVRSNIVRESELSSQVSDLQEQVNNLRTQKATQPLPVQSPHPAQVNYDARFGPQTSAHDAMGGLNPLPSDKSGAPKSLPPIVPKIDSAGRPHSPNGKFLPKPK